MEFNIESVALLFLSGDPKAQRKVRVALQDPVYLLCYRRLKDISEAKTATAYVIEKFLKHAQNNSEDHDALQAYLLTTIYTTCTDMWRRRIMERNETYISDEAPSVWEVRVEEWRQAQAIRDLFEEITVGLSQLPVDDQEAFSLRFKEGLKLKEIAERQDIGLESVRRHLDKTLKKVRIFLKTKGWKIPVWIILFAASFSQKKSVKTGKNSINAPCTEVGWFSENSGKEQNDNHLKNDNNL